jgi:hypothetical protein
LEKGWAKKQPFRKRLDQKLQPMAGPKTTFYKRSNREKVQAKQVGPKNNLLGKGWAKNYNRWLEKFRGSRLGKKQPFISDAIGKKYKIK